MLLTFSEPLDEPSANLRSNYNINNSINNPDQIIYSRFIPHQVTLVFNTKKIMSGVYYTVTVNGVKDRSNNSKLMSLPFVYAVTPAKEDIVITEVLADPYSGGEDFVEIFNKSTKFLKLDSIILRNAQKSENRARCV